MKIVLEQKQNTEKDISRRPIKSRSAKWSVTLAASLAKAGVSPNFVSSMSVVFALVGGVLLFFAPKLAPFAQLACFIGVAVCVQMRLICNLMDGMIAVEYGKQSKLGAVFNEFPDRLADAIFLVLAGYASQYGQIGNELGWLAALLAVLTAYIRAFAVSLGLQNDFCGPMAKPHRMFVLTVASLLAAGEAALGMTPNVLFYGLCIIALGTVITCIRRTMHIAVALKNKSN